MRDKYAGIGPNEAWLAQGSWNGLGLSLPALAASDTSQGEKVWGSPEVDAGSLGKKRPDSTKAFLAAARGWEWRKGV